MFIGNSLISIYAKHGIFFRTNLLNIEESDRAFSGLKDAQQYFVLRRMAFDLNLDATLVWCPIVREEDGLALSSRNLYLSPEERKAAPVLFRALSLGRALLEAGEKDLEKTLGTIKGEIGKEPLIKLEYLEAVSSETLESAKDAKGEILVALAARLGRARLIDNFLFKAG
jgi:pantoate--beta-alanine ligase